MLSSVAVTASSPARCRTQLESRGGCKNCVDTLDSANCEGVVRSSSSTLGSKGVNEILNLAQHNIWIMHLLAPFSC